ncbi:MAG: pyridoxal phosphate-dependent aminotransferase [Candidatus Verstraetearchaeota archaeon]|nr:pyridoxal phosphate-dependent aminotransferase [Candidatus Verstraetearchaeota archaeon]
MQLSSRILNLKESGTLKILDKVKSLQAKGVDVIQLDVGEPDFDTPRNIVEAAYRAMRDGLTHYTPSAGIPELRDAIAEKLRSENGLDVRRENVLITPGSKQALFYAIMALVGEGDEVILPTPAWPSYAEMVTVAGGVVREVPPREGFSPDVEGIKEAVSNRTKIIIINSPNNPTGCVYTEGELKNIAEVAADSKTFVVSDEIYEKILYEGRFRSLGSFPGLEDLVVTVNGFSKTYAMTGWRVGYAAGPKGIISAMNKLQQHSASCAASFAQWAALEALKPETQVQPMVEEFRRRRDFLCRALNGTGAFCVDAPGGAFYLFPDISKTGMVSSQLCDFLLERAHVSVTPGEVFGGFTDNIRISYANSMERLKEAVSRIRSALDGRGFA